MFFALAQKIYKKINETIHARSLRVMRFTEHSYTKFRTDCVAHALQAWSSGVKERNERSIL